MRNITLQITTSEIDHYCDRCDEVIASGEKYWEKIDDGIVVYVEHCNCTEHEHNYVGVSE